MGMYDDLDSSGTSEKSRGTTQPPAFGAGTVKHWRERKLPVLGGWDKYEEEEREKNVGIHRSHDRQRAGTSAPELMVLP